MKVFKKEDNYEYEEEKLFMMNLEDEILKFSAQLIATDDLQQRLFYKIGHCSLKQLLNYHKQKNLPW